MTPEEIIKKLERQLAVEVEKRMLLEVEVDKLREQEARRVCEECRWPRFVVFTDGRREKLPCSIHGVVAGG